ncbi:MAG: AMP-binding protein [Raoultibacter sp.]
MIALLEQAARSHPSAPCFTFEGRSFTYAQVRLCAAGLADALSRRGVRRTSAVVCEMENCPAFVFLTLAAAYGGFCVVALNHRLTAVEKAERVADLRRTQGVNITLQLDEAAVMQLVDTLRPSGASRTQPAAASRTQSATRESTLPRTQLAARTLAHHAQRFAAQFSPQQRALILFTSGTSGKPKAVALSWENLIGAARASNAVLDLGSPVLWQLALPLYHVGGFQVMVRSLCNAAPFVLYRHFDAAQILHEALQLEATHLSVVDKMLQDALDAAAQDEEAHAALAAYRCVLLGGAAPNPHTLERAAAAGVRVYASYGMTETSSQIASRLVTRDFAGQLDLLPGYEATIIGPDAEGVGQLAVKGPGVFSGYVNARAAFTADGFFLTGDLARLRKGRLRVAERTQDMFVSGGENVYPAEIQAKLMQVEGVADAYAFGVPDAAWGRRPVAFVERSAAPITPPATTPVAPPVTPLVGTPATTPSPAAPPMPTSLQEFSAQVESALQGTLSPLYFPQCICAVEAFPRTGIGKVDKAALRKRYQQRLEVERVEVFHIKLPLVAPIRTAKTVLDQRESLIVRITDYQGRTGLAECVAFESDWYLPETIEDDLRVLQDQLIPQVLRQVFLHPDEVTASFARCEDAATHPLAAAALEPALWDLYGKIVEQPLWQLIGGVAPATSCDATCEDAAAAATATRNAAATSNNDTSAVRVPGGVVLGLASEKDTLAAVRSAVAEGYTRVKLKICPGHDYKVLAAVRAAFPTLTLMADANQSYGEDDLPALLKLDTLGLACIEEPLRPLPPSISDPATATATAATTAADRAATDFATTTPATTAADRVALYGRLAALQRRMATPVCLDESFTTVDDLRAALAFPELRCFAVKIAKFGGIAVAAAFCRWAQARGYIVWLGGMYDTGVSKRMHAAFQTLPNISLPGDLSDSARYFPCDITTPPFVLEGGSVLVNAPDHAFGLGCGLDEAALGAATLTHYSYTL